MLAAERTPVGTLLDPRHYIDNLKQREDTRYFATAAFKVGGFNVFGMDRCPERIDFFVNGQKTFTYPKLANDTTGTQWPFNRPFYIILDRAL